MSNGMEEVKLLLTTENVSSIWELVLQDVRARDKTLYVLLTSHGGCSLFVSNSTLYIEPKTDWQRKRIDEPRVRLLLEKLIGKRVELQGPFQCISSSERELIASDEIQRYINALDTEWLLLSNEAELIEEISHCYELIKTKRRHYKAFEKQAAKFGLLIPTHIIIAMEDVEEEIRILESKIDELKQTMIRPRQERMERGINLANIIREKLERLRESIKEIQADLDDMNPIISCIEDNRGNLTLIEDEIKQFRKTDSLRGQKFGLLRLAEEIKKMLASIEKVEHDVKSKHSMNSSQASPGILRMDGIKELSMSLRARIQQAESQVKTNESILEQINKITTALQSDITKIRNQGG